jgi:hypothetical protein
MPVEDGTQRPSATPSYIGGFVHTIGLLITVVANHPY